MSFDGALIKEQGVTFAIAVVKPYVLTSPEKESIRLGFMRYFGNIPIILMVQNQKRYSDIRWLQGYCTLFGKYTPIQNTLETLHNNLI